MIAGRDDLLAVGDLSDILLHILGLIDFHDASPMCDSLLFWYGVLIRVSIACGCCYMRLWKNNKFQINQRYL